MVRYLHAWTNSIQYTVDVSGPYEQIERTVLQAEEELGPLFLLANCAGYARAARFEDTSVEEIKVWLQIVCIP